MQRIDIIIGIVVFALVAAWLYLLLCVCWAYGVIIAIGVIFTVIVAVVQELFSKNNKRGH